MARRTSVEKKTLDNYKHDLYSIARQLKYPQYVLDGILLSESESEADMWMKTGRYSI